MQIKSIHRIYRKSIESKDEIHQQVLKGLQMKWEMLLNYKQLQEFLVDKHPYIVTVFIEPLNPKYWNKKEYVKKEPYSIPSLYHEKLFDRFTSDCGGRTEMNEVYSTYIEKYTPIIAKMKESIPASDTLDGVISKSNLSIDEYIIQHELEPKYREEIEKTYRTNALFFKPRKKIYRQRKYNLPKPLDALRCNYLYDSFFIWEQGKEKFAVHGNGKTSLNRQMYSLFAYALYDLERYIQIPTYVFLYSENNELCFLKKIDEVCLSHVDIGSNYHIPTKEHNSLLKDKLFLKWEGCLEFDVLDLMRI